MMITMLITIMIMITITTTKITIMMIFRRRTKGSHSRYRKEGYKSPK